MNSMQLSNNKKFNYSSAYFKEELQAIEFTLATDYSFNEVYDVFSEKGNQYDKNNLGTITLSDSNNNLLGIWKGFTDLISIKLEEITNFSNLGEKEISRFTKITLKKETVSETYMRESNIKITQLENENSAVKMENEQLKSSIADLWEVVLLGGNEQ